MQRVIEVDRNGSIVWAWNAPDHFLFIEEGGEKRVAFSENGNLVEFPYDFYFTYPYENQSVGGGAIVLQLLRSRKLFFHLKALNRVKSFLRFKKWRRSTFSIGV